MMIEGANLRFIRGQPAPCSMLTASAIDAQPWVRLSGRSRQFPSNADEHQLGGERDWALCTQRG